MMRAHAKALRCLLICAGITAAPTALAQSENPEWIEELKLQLAVEKECAADFFLNILERDWANNFLQAARVQCNDGRMFDAERTEPDGSFRLETCARQVCDAGSTPRKTGFVQQPIHR